MEFIKIFDKFYSFWKSPKIWFPIIEKFQIEKIKKCKPKIKSKKSKNIISKKYFKMMTRDRALRLGMSLGHISPVLPQWSKEILKFKMGLFKRRYLKNAILKPIFRIYLQNFIFRKVQINNFQIPKI